MNERPEVLKLADALVATPRGRLVHHLQAALELYRQHAEIERLRGELASLREQKPVAKVYVQRSGGNAGIAWSAYPVDDCNVQPDGEMLYLAAGGTPSEPNKLAALGAELKTFQWVGEDAGWNLAIEAVRTRISAMLAERSKS